MYVGVVHLDKGLLSWEGGTGGVDSVLVILPVWYGGVCVVLILPMNME